MSRYADAFHRLRAREEGAFCAFLMLGHPDLATSEILLRALVAAGADMIEIGIPFSDPIADGPVIAAAARRALQNGVRPGDCFDAIRRFRAEDSVTPLGVLTYANLVIQPGIDHFYKSSAAAGVDSVLVADAPLLEAAPFVEAANSAGIAPVLIAASNTDERRLQAIARLSEGYVYCVARAGVTGADQDISLDHSAVFDVLARAGAPPAMLGFGIAAPDHVAKALRAGAAGCISGSAIVERAAHSIDAAAEFVAAMKAATRTRP
ncbi:MAG: tryptophan synthase subunit alpha [Hyphomonadaceae bacterium]